MSERYMSLKKRIWEIAEVGQDGDTLSRAFDIFILALIFLNVSAVILETVDWIYALAPTFFRVFECVSVLIFTLEYAARVWSCTCGERYGRPLAGRLRFMLKPMMLIDLMAIAPFYLASYGSLRVVRVLRLLRLFRVLKVARYSSAVKTLGKVLKIKREELLVSVFVLLMLLVLSSSLIYCTEHEAQPEAFASIPKAMWWAVATLTTIGYGDIHPVTTVGKLIASIIAVLGIALFALPAGILASGFIEEFQGENKSVCPHCGKELK